MKFGIGELIVIFIVALVILGPDKLPLYAKKLGEAIGKFKDAAGEATKDLRESVEEPLREAEKPLREAMDQAEASVREAENAIKNAGKPSAEKKASTGTETDAEKKEETV